MKRTRIFGITIIALALLIGGAAVIIDGLREPAPRSGTTSTSGTVSIGGPYALTSHTGARVTEQSFRGSYQLIYFGYTFCPDVCPTELQDLAAVLDELGDAAEQVTPVFITIDPARDDVESMALFVGNIHPRMIGLTGTEDEIRAVAKDWRVYRSKQGDDPEDYLMDHSTYAYLAAPGEGVLEFFRRDESAEEVARRAACFIEKL